MALSSKSKPTGKKTTNSGKKSKTEKKPWGILFWMLFIIVVFGLFIVNIDNIRSTLNDVERIRRPDPQSTIEDPEQLINENGGSGIVVLAPENSQPATGPLTETQTNEPPASAPSAQQPEVVTQPQVQQNQPQSTAPAGTPPATTAPSTIATNTPAPVLRERALYLINVDSSGTILRTKVTRNLPVTDSPLTDVLTALFVGPLPEERNRGLISLIPAGTKFVTSPIIRGTTAYLNLSEDFQFNTYGIEGYAGSLRQIIWTATEFSTIDDVQILIEGRRVDYLGEGVWIGSPVSRDML